MNYKIVATLTECLYVLALYSHSKLTRCYHPRFTVKTESEKNKLLQNFKPGQKLNQVPFHYTFLLISFSLLRVTNEVAEIFSEDLSAFL